MKGDFFLFYPLLRHEFYKRARWLTSLLLALLSHREDSKVWAQAKLGRKHSNCALWTLKCPNKCMSCKWGLIKSSWLQTNNITISIYPSNKLPQENLGQLGPIAANCKGSPDQVSLPHGSPIHWICPTNEWASAVYPDRKKKKNQTSNGAVCRSSWQRLNVLINEKLRSIQTQLMVIYITLMVSVNPQNPKAGWIDSTSTAQNSNYMSGCIQSSTICTKANKQLRRILKMQTSFLVWFGSTWNGPLSQLWWVQLEWDQPYAPQSTNILIYYSC